jgi:hypothetical protein
VCGKSDGNERCGRPSKESRHRVCEEPPCPSERARDIAAAENRDSLHRERAGEEHREQNENDPDELAP